MGDSIKYPQISGLNWPSNLLHAVLALYGVGVPEENARLLPEIGHFAAPEVEEESIHNDPDAESNVLSRRHPLSPRLEHVINQGVTRDVVRGTESDPELLMPRLTVNVRAETLLRVLFDEAGNEVDYRHEIVGRLAHFMPPLVGGLFPQIVAREEAEADPSRNPGGPTLDAYQRVGMRPGEKPLDMLARQMCRQYPELIQTLSNEVWETLDELCEEFEKVLTATTPEEEEVRLLATAEVPGKLTEYEVCRESFLGLAEKLQFAEEDGIPQTMVRAERVQFRRWADALFRPELEDRLRALKRLLEPLDAEQRQSQHRFLLKFMKTLDYERPRERYRVVREILEIMTTMVFYATAAVDCLWGMGWIHGRMSDFRINDLRLPPDTEPPFDPILMSITGGIDHRTLLVNLMRGWAAQSAFVGIGQPNVNAYGEPLPGREQLDIAVLTEEEQREFWALIAWRREAGDPLAVLETGAQRLVHPEVRIDRHRFTGAASAFGSLFMQPGSTAVMGGKGLMQYPRVVISVPLAEDVDDEAKIAKAKLDLLLRAFLPIGFRVEIVWQEAVARLGRSSYLKHDFQQGIRLVSLWESLNDTVDFDNYDSPML